MLLLLKALYFFLPAYFANMSPVIFQKVPVLNKPISERFFGKNKTWRGLVSAVLVGFLVYLLQVVLYRFSFNVIALGNNGWFWSLVQEISLINYLEYSLWLGFLLGFGAILGDIIESYVKRKVGFKPGDSWFPFDQLDFVIGALLLSALVYVPGVLVVTIILIVSPLLHLATNYVAYLVGVRDAKY